MATDREIVTAQIERPPRGFLRVAARCRWGYPTVVTVHPLLGDAERGAPFPTTHWLTCPAIARQVAGVEASGGVRALDEEATRDAGLAAAIAADHAAQAEERWALLDEREREQVRARGLEPVIRDSGIGGSRDRLHVKCLHAWTGHHLVRGNVVGRRLTTDPGLDECPEDAVHCRRWGSPPEPVTPRDEK